MFKYFQVQFEGANNDAVLYYPDGVKVADNAFAGMTYVKWKAGYPQNDDLTKTCVYLTGSNWDLANAKCDGFYNHSSAAPDTSLLFMVIDL